MSMQQIVDIDKAVAFLRQELSEGTTLAKLVLDRIDFSQGRYFAWTPSTTDQTKISDFRWSVRLSPDAEQRDFARFVKAFTRNSNRAVIIQDIVSDNIYEDDEFRHLAIRYNGELYWRIEGDLSEDDILLLIRGPVLPYPWTGFFYSRDSLGLKAQLKDADLHDIVRNLFGVAVGAFDADSFLMWWDNRFELPPYR
jgi:hypothetical protein